MPPGLLEGFLSLVLVQHAYHRTTRLLLKRSDHALIHLPLGLSALNVEAWRLYLGLNQLSS